MIREHDNGPVFLTTKELAARWKMSCRTLEGWRDKRIGLPWILVGSRVRYNLADVEQCERLWRVGEFDDD